MNPLALVFASLLSAFAQEPQQPTPDVSLFGKRYDAFRSMFAQRKLQIGNAADFSLTTPVDAKGWIVVALGDVREIPAPACGWERFVEAGGTILVATDRGEAPIGDVFRVSFKPQPVLADPKADPPVECYPSSPDCPLIFDFTDNSPLFAEIELLALNRSGYLEVPQFRGQRTTSARLPRGVTDAAGTAVGGKAVVFGTARDQGRWLFAADHSLFINETMLNHQDEVLNAPFANNAVDWLVAGRDAETVKVLFLEDGKLIDSWVDPRYLSGDWPTNTLQEKVQALDKLLRAVNRMILEQQSRRDPNTGLTLYNQAVRNWESKQRPGAFLQAAIWGLAAFLAMTTAAWLLGRRMARLQHPPAAATADGKPVAPPPYGPKSEDDPMHRSLLDRRRVEMLEEGHYVDLARRLSRVWMTQQLGSPPSGSPVDLPAIRRSNRHLLHRWREAWSLATDESHPPMSLKDFQKFRADLSALQARLDSHRRNEDAWGMSSMKENA